jgi:hypothetical protein
MPPAYAGAVTRTDKVLLGATTVALLAVALLLALLGAFLSPAEPHVLHVPVPVGVLIAVFGNLVVGIGGAWGTGTRMAPALTGLAWAVVAFVMGVRRPDGDLVVPGSGWHGVAYLYLGLIAAAVAIGIGPDGLRGRRAAASAAPPPTRPSLGGEMRR